MTVYFTRNHHECAFVAIERIVPGSVRLNEQRQNKKAVNRVHETVIIPIWPHRSAFCFLFSAKLCKCSARFRCLLRPRPQTARTRERNENLKLIWLGWKYFLPFIDELPHSIFDFNLVQLNYFFKKNLFVFVFSVNFKIKIVSRAASHFIMRATMYHK